MGSEYEFSREIDMADLADGEVELEMFASLAEREALTKRFGIAALDRLEARVGARRLADGIYGVRGRLSAEVVQSCVVTLGPVAVRLDEGFSVTWAPGIGWADEGETLVEVEGARPFGGEGTTIDVGEAVVQQLALALDPYPRAPGAEVAVKADDDAREEDGPRPFGALAQLRRQRD